MPNYKKMNYRRKRGPKKVFVRKTKKLVTGQGPTMLEKIASYAGPIAQVARAVIPAITAINTEAKYLDVNSSSTTATLTASFIVNLTAMAQGLTDVTRVGNSLLAKDVSINIRCIQNVTAGTTNLTTIVRVLMFVDKFQEGVVPTLAQIMQDPTTTLSKTNKNFTDRFVVLHDSVIDMAPNYSTHLPRYDFKWFNKLDFHIRYLGATAAAADMGPNQVFVMYWPNTATAGDTNVGGYSRFNFTDN